MIGISAYKDWPLNNSVNDARAMKRLLEERGVKVFYVENCTLTKMKLVQDEFLSYVQPGDTAIFYFAGRGCTYLNSPRLMMIAESDTASKKRDSLNVYALSAK